jgi:hypothetical protein
MMPNNYSVDMLKKYAFLDELNNFLKLKPVDQIDKDTQSVIEYLENRVKEIEKKYKKAA